MSFYVADVFGYVMTGPPLVYQSDRQGACVGIYIKKKNCPLCVDVTKNSKCK